MATKLFRVPLVGAYNTRIATSGAAPAASGIVGIGVVGLMVIGSTTQSTDKDQKFVNCFTQTVSDPVTDKKRIYTVKRAGFATHTTPAAGQKGYALLVWTGQGAGTSVISAFGETNSTIYNGTTSLGAITGRATGISETSLYASVDVAPTPTLTVSSSDSTAWYYDTAVAAMTKISGNFPGNAGKTIVGTFAHINGFACIMTDDGRLYASDLNSVTNWKTNSFDSANAYPDKGIGCVRFREYIIAFGTESMQFYFLPPGGLTPFPFSKAQSMTHKVGAIAADAIARIADTIFFCGSTPEGGLSIFQYDGNLQRASTPEVDAIMILAGASNVTLTTIRFYGRSFVIVRAGPTTLAYCIEEKTWHEWASVTPLWYKCVGVSLGASMVNYAVSNISTSGKVYKVDHANLVFTDDGVSYSAIIQLAPMDFGTNRRKSWTDVEIIGDRETSASAITLSSSDDDYQTRTQWGNLDLSEARPRATRLGASRRRGWVLTHTASTPMRLEALEGNAVIGT